MEPDKMISVCGTICTESDYFKKKLYFLEISIYEQNVHLLAYFIRDYTIRLISYQIH